MSYGIRIPIDTITRLLYVPDDEDPRIYLELWDGNENRGKGGWYPISIRVGEQYCSIAALCNAFARLEKLLVLQ